MRLDLHRSPKILLPVVWVILGTYCFLVFLQMPVGIGTGLDPSWLYAISRAAQDKLVFGRDVIFTYGPLGYLIAGSAGSENFFEILVFHFAAHLVAFGLASAKIIKLRHNWQKLFFILSLLLPYLMSVLLHIFLDYEILFAFIILLSFDSILYGRRRNLWFLILGAVSGFCLLTKFTLGVCTIGSLLLLSLTNLYTSLKERDNLVSSVYCLLNVLLSSASIVFIYLNPDRVVSFNKILICLTVSCVVATLAEVLRKVVQLRISTKQSTRKTVFRSWQSTSLLSFYISYSICLSLTILYTSPSIVEYLKSSLELSSGYSSAMSLTGSPWELGFALSEIILLLMLLIKSTSKKSIGFSLSLAFILWIIFKHGFVRQDAHVLYFVTSTPLIASLYIDKIRKHRTLQFAFLTQSYILVVALSFCLLLSPFTNIVSQSFNSSIVISKAFSLLDIRKAVDAIEAANIVNLEGVKLPQSITTLLKNKKVDVIPWEISIVAANNLNWKPSPVFQSYAAYTTFLDDKNSKSILSEPRDYIIYHFSAIDDRHPFFDEPEAFFNIFCNYKPANALPNLVNTPNNLLKLIILEKRPLSICSAVTTEETSSIPWKRSQSVKVSDGTLSRVAVNIKYSVFGKIYKTIFRAPPVKMKVRYSDNSTKSYRIIPENSSNGVMISYLPKNDAQALSLFQGQLYNPVNSFSFSTRNPFLYKQDIDITFLSSVILDPSFKNRSSFNKIGQIDVSHLKNISFLPALANGFMGFMDTKQEGKAQLFSREDVISASGWGTRTLSKGEKYQVLLTYGSDNTPLTITETGESRPDVGKHFNNIKYNYSGWSTSFSVDAMPDGIHDIKAWVYDPASNTAVPLTGVYRVEIH